MFLPYISYLSLLLLLVSFVWFAFALYAQRNDVADIAWGVNAVVIATFTYAFTPVSPISPQGTLLLCIAIWGAHLALHKTKRNALRDEDDRYRRFRGMWGNLFVPRSYFSIFLLQTIFIAIISLPAWYVASFGESFSWNAISVFGAALWGFGFLFEAIADVQLTRFLKRKNPPGSVLQSGLRAYSRHPNYFGETLAWWGIFFIALSFPHGYLTIISPALLTFSLLKVTGVPLTEKSFQGNLAYGAYKDRVSAFVPLPPKRVK